MKNFIKSLFIVSVLVFIGCGGGDKKKEKREIKIGNYNKTETKKTSETPSTKTDEMDLSNKGVGPVKNLELPETIDQAMAATGEKAFKIKCAACHRPAQKFIGPALLGVLDRRAPEWVMNMILDPEGMVKNDPVAKQLLIEYNGVPMANQSLTEEEARSILEYFRTLKE
jgi:mono/diheme cytochrome c family protein